MITLTALIIDDSPENAEVYREFLQDDPAVTYDFHCVELAADALDLLTHITPDIVLLDYQLPDMTGLELLAEIQHQTPDPPYPVIMMTNMGSEEIAVQALKMGVTEYIIKDQVSFDTLPPLIHDALHKFRHQDKETQIQSQIINLLYAPATKNIIQQLKNTPELRLTTILSIDTIDTDSIINSNTLILTDYTLPDGRDALPLLQTQFPTVPIIVVSSTATELQAIHAIKQGADDYLTIHSERINSLREIVLAHLSEHKRTVSEQKASRELHQQRNILELFIEHTPAAVAMLDRDFRYIIASRQWYLDYNLQYDNITGMSHYAVFPEIGDNWKAIHQECLNGSIHRNDADALTREDGNVDYIKWEVRPWFELDGAIGGIIMFTEVITDKVNTQQQLVQSELRYQQLVSNLPDTAVIMFDENMRYTLAIGSLLEETGYNPSAMIGKTIQEVLPPQSQEALLPAYRQVLNGGQFNIIREFAIKDETRVFNSQFVPIFDFDEQVAKGMIVTRDITAQHNAQKQLRESERRFKGIFNQTFQFIGLLETDGTLITANDTALAFGGITIDEIADKPFWEASWWSYSDELQEQLKGWIDRAAQGELIREEPLVRGGDGSFATIDFSIKPLLDDNGDVILLIPEGRDITERIHMETELNQKYKELDRFFTVSVDLLCIADIDGNFLRVNNAFERILGYTKDELEGKSFMNLIHPDDVQATQDALVELTEQNPIWSFTNRYRTKTGDYRYIEWRSQPHGEYIYAAARDITERIKADRNLQAAFRNLQRVNQEIQQFANIISHDLRSPLINIKGFISIIEKSQQNLAALEETILPHLDDEQIQAWEQITGKRFETAVNFIHNSVEKMDKYTSSILKLARIGRREFKMKEINSVKIVQSVVDTLASQIEDNNINIQIDDMPTIITDELAFDQIFSNLITNAVKYLDKDRTGHILISADIEPDRFIFDIQDKGRGIREADYDKVFAPFRRIGENTVAGEGMGLAYVQALIRGLGGDIWFESTINKGTTFSFSIPRDYKTHE